MRDLPMLETERLLLRPFESSDAARVQQLAGDKRVAEVTAHIPHPYPDGAAEAWIATHRQQWERDNGIVYALVIKAEGVLIGAMSILDIQDGEGELGYWLGVPYWGRGYCTEALRALLGFMSGSGLLRRVHARHLARNPASGRVLVKAGFVHCGQVVAACGNRPETEPIEAYEYYLSPAKS